MFDLELILLCNMIQQCVKLCTHMWFPRKVKKVITSHSHDPESSLCPSLSVLSSADLATSALRIPFHFTPTLLSVFSFPFPSSLVHLPYFHFQVLSALEFLGEKQDKCCKLLLADSEYLSQHWLSSLLRLVRIFPLWLCGSHNLASISNVLGRRGKNKWGCYDLSWQNNFSIRLSCLM